MKKQLSVLLVLAMALALSGCAGKNGIDRVNEMIAESNSQRLVAYASGMAACRENAACQVGVTGAFYSGAGQQQFLRPETPLDYAREARMWIDPVGNLIDRLNGGTGGISGDRAASVIRGDGNLVLIGNRASADNGSTTGFSLNPTFTRSWNGYNRNFTGQQPITDEGLGEVAGVQ